VYWLTGFFVVCVQCVHSQIAKRDRNKCAYQLQSNANEQVEYKFDREHFAECAVKHQSRQKVAQLFSIHGLCAIHATAITHTRTVRPAGVRTPPPERVEFNQISLAPRGQTTCSKKARSLRSAYNQQARQLNSPAHNTAGEIWPVNYS